MKVILLRGASGSGKSTFAGKLTDSRIVSADQYHVRDNVYSWTQENVSAAHKWCYRNFYFALLDCVPQIVVDNTNLTLDRISPYYALACLFDYTVHVVDFFTNHENIHGVSQEIVEAKREELSTVILPLEWEITRYIILTDDCQNRVIGELNNE